MGSVKDDTKSLAVAHRCRPEPNSERRELSETDRPGVLTNAGLRLVSIRRAQNLEPAERLLRGEALFVESDAL